MSYNVAEIRKDFPSLDQKIYGRQLVYLDNAATTQKPLDVIRSISDYYSTINSNIHRGVHYLSQEATNAYEGTRKVVQHFINARHDHEIIFTKGTTEAINLVACSFGRKFISKGDEIIISALEHHSNIVPWQILCEEKGARLRVIPINDDNEIMVSKFPEMLNDRTRIVAITHISNALGTVVPLKEIIKIAHTHNIPVLVDGAQAVAHMRVDVQDLDCDFYCFSGHKMYGPMGIGILYGRERLLEDMPPYQGGGEMIRTVTFEKTTYNDLPYKFEAGTPNVADVIGFKTAIDYLDKIGFENITPYEAGVYKYATTALESIEGLRIIGTGKNKSGVISFLIGNIHYFDAGTVLDKLGIAVRTGNHCAQPLMELCRLTGTVRASFAMYNTKEEVDILTDGIIKVKELFG
ncbi:MAG: cysteine desulfurase [Bacteroidetes bacterium]|nr:cysteine desulfurase [Bacteroidota bacterium]